VKYPTHRSTFIEDRVQAIEEAVSYYDGFHFDFWCGPRIDPQEPRAAQLMREVERVFQSTNLIRECVDRHIVALIGKFPHWYLKDEKGKRIDSKGNDRAAAAEVELQRWIDTVLQKAANGEAANGEEDPLFESVKQLVLTGESALRLWQPKRFENAADPIDRIHLHAVPPVALKVTRGEDGFIDELEYRYGNGKVETERFLEDGRLEITGSDIAEAIQIDTGGRWTIAQMRSPSILSPQIKQNQNAINHSLTMMLRNQEQAGFLDRIFLNAQPPGDWVKDETAPTGERFVPNGAGLEKGAGQDTFIFGVPTGDPTNPSGITNPTVITNQPVSPDSFIASIAQYRELIYHAFGQGHLLSSGDGAINGVSRIQLRQDFEVKLTRQKRAIEAAIGNIFNVVLRLLEYEDFEVVVQLRISTGKLSPEERQMVINEFSKGLMSKSTAMALLASVDDTDSEIALITAERETEMEPRIEVDPAL